MQGPEAGKHLGVTEATAPGTTKETDEAKECPEDRALWALVKFGLTPRWEPWSPDLSLDANGMPAAQGREQTVGWEGKAGKPGGGDGSRSRR